VERIGQHYILAEDDGLEDWQDLLESMPIPKKAPVKNEESKRHYWFVVVVLAVTPIDHSHRYIVAMMMMMMTNDTWRKERKRNKLLKGASYARLSTSNRSESRAFSVFAACRITTKQKANMSN
jgi:hypothetical protein